MKNSNQVPITTITEDADSVKIVLKASKLSDAGKHEEALHVLSAGSSNALSIVNARAVCQMRLGRHASALKTLRALVVQSGCTWMKRELPVIYRTNFVTAVLLSNLPNGVRETLFEIPETSHPSVIRLQDVLTAWQKSLSWWQRLNWKMGVAPAVPISLYFVPGDFVDPIANGIATPPQLTTVQSQNNTHQVA